MVPGRRQFWIHTLIVLGCGVTVGILIGLLEARSYRIPHGRMALQGRDTIRVAACFHTGSADRLGYAIGFEYALLKKYGETEGVVVQMMPGEPDSVDRWSELEDSGTDIVIADARDTVTGCRERSSKLCIRSGDCVWAVRWRDSRLLSNLNRWLSVYTETGEYADMKARFSRHCLMGSDSDILSAAGSLHTFISPYDDLIRYNAGILGWDWRLLASLVCQESKFVMFAVSSKNAAGLMQVRRVTADYYGVPLTFDPQENIRLGTLHLSRIQSMFSSDVYSREDAVRFTLAAYNCGVGRISECMEYASAHGLNPGNWEDVATAVSLMKQEGSFHGTGTLGFVMEVLSRYEVYRRAVRE